MLKRKVIYSGWDISQLKDRWLPDIEITVLLVDKWASLYEEQSGSERCQEMPWWREKYWGLQELRSLLNEHSMMLLESHLSCFHVQLSLPCLYTCCKGTILGSICMERIPAHFSNCFWKQYRKQLLKVKTDCDNRLLLIDSELNRMTVTFRTAWYFFIFELLSYPVYFVVVSRSYT